MLHYIILGLCVVILNILDDVTTYVGLHKLPMELRGEEANPLMKGLMDKDSVLASIVKELGILLLVALFVYIKDGTTLFFLLYAFGIVVVSNTSLIIGRLITKKKKDTYSLLYLMLTWCRVPQRCQGIAGWIMVVIISVICSRLSY